MHYISLFLVFIDSFLTISFSTESYLMWFYWEHTHGMGKSSFSPKYTEMQKLNNLLYNMTKGPEVTFSWWLGADGPGNVSMETSKHLITLFQWMGQTPASVASFLWTFLNDRTKTQSIPHPRFPSTQSSANQICRPETRKEVSSAGPLCSASEEKPSL